MNKNNQISSRIKTDYLKGLAIFSVLMNHFLNSYFQIDSQGYANGIIAIFFVLSGFGIYYSLQKRLNEKNKQSRILFNFYFDRIIRIYPLYILTLLLDTFFMGKNYSSLAFLGIKSQKYWFVLFIIQCYLFAYIFYIILKKLGTIKFILLSILFFIVFNFLYFYSLGKYDFLSLTKSILIYRRLFIAHILLFSAGMVIPIFIKKIKGKQNNKIFLYIFCFLFIVFLYLTRTILGNQLDIINSIIFILIIPILIYLFLINELSLFLQSTFAFLGTISYSIYLFHGKFFLILKYLGIIENNSFFSIIFMLLLLPFFLIFCYIIEKVIANISITIRKYLV